MEVYTVAEVAEKLKVTTRSVYTYIKTGKLKAIKLGRGWRVTEDSLKAFLEVGTK